ncbi:hypothetical protein AVEN_1950-1 [Araneus ventricosus]|uniref:DDE-1 domain-containing protein n=1 Tax=Araneus ventricosus TaxID=182803 RepID=A0A4Y2P8U9_ARAVE|nr:hypothetical protein AVEN_1950-1 [Araneus ventricosus]
MVSSRIYSICKKNLKSQKLPIKALLVLDNEPSHPSEEKLKDNNIQAVFLPPNVTAFITVHGPEPLTQNVNRRYRRRLLRA